MGRACLSTPTTNVSPRFSRTTALRRRRATSHPTTDATVMTCDIHLNLDTKSDTNRLATHVMRDDIDQKRRNSTRPERFRPLRRPSR